MSYNYTFSLHQHIGYPSVAVVKPGDKVLRGQLIAAKPKNVLGASIHSSVSGVVVSVTEAEIRIEEEGSYNSDFLKLEQKAPLQMIEDAGIVGLGGAGFPTYQKLSQEEIIGGTVIVNAAECEPVLCHNIFAIEKNPKQLLRGLEIVMDIIKAKEGVIAIKEKHINAIESLNSVISSDKIRVHTLPDMYPMGEERAVIREVTGKLLAVQDLPSSVGIVVLNAETICRIQECVDLRKPLIDKNLTIAGKLKETAVSIKVLENLPVGMSVPAVLESEGGIADESGEIIIGGPYTGKRASSESSIEKTTGGIIATECFIKDSRKIGLLVCACGASEARMRELAKSMGGEVVAAEYCKQARKVKNSYKCENPGRCPGQIAKVLALKKAGAGALLIGNCTDCSNTVMSCAPKLGLSVHHITDGALRSVNHCLIRRIKK